jgi:protein dpy-30
MTIHWKYHSLSFSQSLSAFVARQGEFIEKRALEYVPKLNPKSLSFRTYMDTLVTPHLLKALNAVAEERPENPAEFFAYYLLQNHPSRVQKAEETAKQEPPKPPAN